MKKAISRLHIALQSSVDWMLPASCLSCAQPFAENDYPLCHSCYATLPFQRFACRRCGQNIASQQDGCGRCLAHPPPYDECFCAFEYRNPISKLVRDFKYHQRPELATPLAQLMARELTAQAVSLPDLVLSVPVHTSRLRSRGYNQSSLLSKKLALLLDIDYQANLLKKTNNTPPQAELSLQQRANNLQGCFALTTQIKAKHVALVDDVVTTGATASEIAKTLKRNGVDYVQVWGVAHTV